MKGLIPPPKNSVESTQYEYLKYNIWPISFYKFAYMYVKWILCGSLLKDTALVCSIFKKSKND